MNNREQFLSLMIDNQLDRLALADMLKVDRDQIDRWLASVESRHHEAIPDMALELLRLKLEQCKPSASE